MRQAALTVGNLSAWGWPSFRPSFLFYHTSPSVCLFLSVSLSLDPVAYKRKISTLKRKHGGKG